MSKVVFADRGQSTELSRTIGGAAGEPTWAAASRLGWLHVALPARSVWLQIRGCSRIDSSEGSFLLQRGEWIAFASGSQPALQSGQGGLVLGLILPATVTGPVFGHRDHLPLSGRGTMPRRNLILALRAWRQSALQVSSGKPASTGPFLLNLLHSQQELVGQLARCPGRSSHRKREMFEKLQRTKLYLDGNSHRIVRISELAAMTGYSIWYLSKAFSCVYEANPHSVAFGYRLGRARHLLANTSLAITEISSACGFSSQATFARAFRSGHGMTASSYRSGACRSGTRPAHVVGKALLSQPIAS